MKYPPEEDANEVKKKMKKKQPEKERLSSSSSSASHTGAPVVQRGHRHVLVSDREDVWALEERGDAVGRFPARRARVDVACRDECDEEIDD